MNRRIAFLIVAAIVIIGALGAFLVTRGDPTPDASAVIRAAQQVGNAN